MHVFSPQRAACATHDGQRGVVAAEPDADDGVKLRFEDGEESEWIPVSKAGHGPSAHRVGETGRGVRGQGGGAM